MLIRRVMWLIAATSARSVIVPHENLLCCLSHGDYLKASERGAERKLCDFLVVMSSNMNGEGSRFFFGDFDHSFFLVI